MRNESGRSMVEMLGVLAIIGVLSVGGIAGYTMAMRKYKANEVVAVAAQCSILARSANAGEGDTSCAVTWPADVDGTPTVTKEGEVTVKFNDSAVCTAAAAIKAAKTGTNKCTTAGEQSLTWAFS